MISALLILMLGQAQALSLDEYLNQVQKNNPLFESQRAQKEAIELRYLGSDISLGPVLQASATQVKDRSPTSQFISFGARESQTNIYSLGLSQKFSSGTGVSLTASAFDAMNPGLENGILGRFARYSTASLGIAVTQSLWKDFFGNAYELRWERQKWTQSVEVSAVELNRRAALVKAESLFWDYLLSVENEKLDRESLDRSKKLLQWTQRRFSDGIAEKADLLQAQALVAARELGLQSSQEQLRSLKAHVLETLNLPKDSPTPVLVGDVSRSRSLDRRREISFEAKLALFEARAKKQSALETQEGLKPDLVLSGSYNTNSFDPTLSQATSNWTSGDQATIRTGISFVYQFDNQAKRGLVNAAKKEAKASELTADKKIREAKIQRDDFYKKYDEISRSIIITEKIAQLQSQRAKEQGNLLSKGRSVTSLAVAAEEDSAAAALNLIRLKTEQRKLEAQDQLFVELGE